MRIVSFVKETLQFYHEEHLMGGYSRIESISHILSWYWKRSVGRLICHVSNRHVIENDDWATPDTGGMSGDCRRCGMSYYHVLY